MSFSERDAVRAADYLIMRYGRSKAGERAHERATALAEACEPELAALWRRIEERIEASPAKG